MGNTESNPWIPLTQSIQEIEKIRFSYDLRKNPDDFNRYVSERIDRITKETMEKKRAAFQKTHTDMGRYFDMDHNANFYKIRNSDVMRLQEQLMERSRAAEQSILYDKDLTRRQAEINEWYYQDKLETLFFLQLFFMVLLAMAIVLYLQKNNFITSPFAAYITLILMGGVIATGLYRNRYTSDFRDSRFWAKRNFREKEIYVPAVPLKPTPDPCKQCQDGPDVMGAPTTSSCAKRALDAQSAKDPAAADADATGAAGQAALARGGDTNAAAFGRSALAREKPTTANAVGESLGRAGSALEMDTVAYQTGDGRTTSANASVPSTCS